MEYQVSVEYHRIFEKHVDWGWSESYSTEAFLEGALHSVGL